MVGKELSVIIPVWNEEKVIRRNLGIVCSVLEKTLPGIGFEIIVVDDGSTDGSVREAGKAARENRTIKVVKELRGGKGSVLKKGFSHSRGRLITFLDADLDLHPAQIKTFLDYMERSTADMVVGSKRHPFSQINYPWRRRFLSGIYQILVRALFNLSIKDTQAGLKLFRREVLEEILPRVLCKKFAFDLELIVNANHRRFRIVEAPVKLDWKRVGSRLRLRDIFRIAVDTAAIFYRLRVLRYYNGGRK